MAEPRDQDAASWSFIGLDIGRGFMSIWLRRDQTVRRQPSNECEALWFVTSHPASHRPPYGVGRGAYRGEQYLGGFGFAFERLGSFDRSLVRRVLPPSTALVSRVIRSADHGASDTSFVSIRGRMVSAVLKTAAGTYEDSFTVHEVTVDDAKRVRAGRAWPNGSFTR